MELPILSYTDITNLTGRSATTGGWGLLDDNKRARFMRVAKFFILRPEKCGAFTLIQDTLFRDVRSKVFLCSQAFPFALTTCVSQIARVRIENCHKACVSESAVFFFSFIGRQWQPSFHR